MKSLQIIAASAAFSLAPMAMADATMNKASAEATSAKNDLKTKFFEMIDKNSIKVDFDKGKAELSEGQRSDLKALVEAQRKEHNVHSFVVAAWSDEDLPSGKQDLSAGERKLAAAREAKVVAYLKTLGVKAEGHTMAEKPTWIAKTFHTKDATVKGSREANADDAQRSTEAIADKIKERGGPRSAVVIATHSL